MDVYGSFSFKNISTELVPLWLFPFLLMEEVTKWLVDLPRDSTTSLEDLIKVF